jgi:hypothetical protein
MYQYIHKKPITVPRPSLSLPLTPTSALQTAKLLSMLSSLGMLQHTELFHFSKGFGHLKLLGFWPLSIIRYPTEHNVSENRLFQPQVSR